MASTPNHLTGQFSLSDPVIFRNRWWQHLLFWGVVFFILLNLFKTSSSLEKIDLIFTFIFLSPIACITYLNLYHFIPRYLKREHYLVYVIFLLALMGSGAVFLYFLFDRWVDLVLPNYYFISYYNVLQLMLFTGSVLLLTTLLKLSRSWFLLLRLERMTTSQQLKSLQSQINPHFLLNSLQTIYALSLDKSEQTPGVILQLSDILKYTLYETGHSSIKLAKEIGMIRDYVEMYRHRVDPARAEIRLELEGDPDGKVIAPMLLIPFIENSFKHGLKGGPGMALIHISIKIGPADLHLQIENSVGKADVVDLEKPQGIGIDNTRQRLELLYPGKHRLSIHSGEDIFKIDMHLQLDQ